MDRSDIQGLVFGSYARQPVSSALLVRFEAGDPGSWLARLLPEVSSALAGEADAQVRLNVAFTFRGLERLGLPPATLAGFAPEFRQGMAHPARSLALGDAGEDAPRHWHFHDGAQGGVDAVVLVYAADVAGLDARLDSLDAGFERFGLEAGELPTYLPADGREHFGFRMGVSEPSILGRRRRGQTRVPLGEFLLGYANGHGERAPTPTAPRRRSTREPPRLLGDASAVAWGFNGTYLVLRKLEQRVAAFWRFAEEAARESGARSVELAAARLIGRWANGAPLSLFPESPPSDPGSLAFGYRELDPLGRRCPLAAHVRRANPRDALGVDARSALRSANLHRLLRRGRLYGPRVEQAGLDDGVERGLVFMALNADLARQFETVQGSQLRYAHFGSARSEREPLLGSGAGDGSAPGRFSVPGEPVRTTLHDLPKFVRVRGGSYFFLPSLSALGYLADLRHADGAAPRPSS